MFLLPANYWEIKETKHKGKGVFAQKDITAGVVIGDYIGNVVHTATFDIDQDTQNLYLMYYHDQASLFPDVKKPGIHLINHSCAPNCWIYTYQGHTLFFSLRHIFAGEELTIAYLLSPQALCNPCPHICLCESRICSQTMHLSQAQYDAWSAYQHLQATVTKRKRITYGKQLPLLDYYPIAIADNPIYTLFGAKHTTPAIFADTSLPEIGELRKRIRATGKTLLFPKINRLVLGINYEETIIETVSQ